MKKRFLVLFFLTLFLSLTIRLYNLTENPEGFEQTEAAFSYNAYSVFKTGRDEDGKFLPLILISVGDYKLAGYMYFQIPFIALLGLNEFSVRLSAVTAGMISLILVYFICIKLLKRRKISLLTLFFTGIAPWHILLSRMGYDPIVAFMFYLLSAAFFVQWHKNRHIYLLLCSSIALSLGILTYYSVWVLAPFTILFYWIYAYKKSKKITSVLTVSLIVLLPILMMGKLLLQTRGERLYQDSTYQNHANPLLAEQIREDQDKFPVFIIRLFHNKLIFYPQFLLQNLSNNLSFDFLFLRGDKGDRRFYVPYSGVLYLWGAPFIFLGILNFWKYRSLSNNFIILGLIGLIFFGSSFSELGSETERTIFAVPLFCFFTGYGLIILSKNLKRYFIFTVFLGCIVAGLVLNMAYFNHQYYYHANIHEAFGRYFGAKEMLISLPPLENKYKKIIIPDSSYIFYYFYSLTDPTTAQAESASRLPTTNFNGLALRAKVGNYLAMPIECPAAGKLHVLYVCRGTNIPKNSKIIKVIRYRDSQPAYTLLEFTLLPSTSPLPANLRYMDKYGIIDEKNDAYWKTEKDLSG